METFLGTVDRYNEISKKIASGISAIKRIRYFLPFEILLNVYNSLVLWNSLSLEVRQLTSPSIFKGKIKGHKFRLANNLISYILSVTHDLLEKQVFSFHFYYFSF